MVGSPVDGSVGKLSEQTTWNLITWVYSVCVVFHLISSCHHSRCRPASSSRCLALGRNSRCLTKSFPLWSWMSLTSSLKVWLGIQTHRDWSNLTQWIQHTVYFSGPQQCMVCGTLAQIECIDCFKDPLFSPTGFKVFCRNCSEQVCPIVSTPESFCLSLA